MADGHAGHLYEIDVIRIITFGAVVAVHAIAFTEPPSNRLAGGALMLLQFGRELFFALMGFVLVYSAQRRYPGARAFWRRRFLFVATPYLAWTGLYWIEDSLTGLHHGLVSDLLTGNAEYHLYFLLVTMQLYLAFPLILRFVRRTASRAWTVLGIVAALNVAWLAALHYATPPTAWSAAVWGRAYELLPTYAVYVLAGCYAGMHVELLVGVLRRFSRLLVRVGAAAAVLALVAYGAQLPHSAPRDAADVLQPAMLLTCVAAVLLLSVCGVRWAYGARRGQRLVQQGSDISFGVYLAHPLVLRLLLAAGLGNDGQRVPAALATVLAFTGAAAGATALTVVARRTPLSLALTGRSRLRSEAPALADLPADSLDPPRVLSAGHATIAS